MRQFLQSIIQTVFVTAVIIGMTLVCAFFVYNLAPAALLALLIAIPAFLWSLRDLWWACSIVIAAILIWCIDFDVPAGFDGPVLSGRSVNRDERYKPNSTRSIGPNSNSRSQQQTSSSPRTSRFEHRRKS